MTVSNEGVEHTKVLNAGLFTVAPLNEQWAEELCSWHYEPPYDFYSWKDWDQMRLHGHEFGDPVIRSLQYAGVLDTNGCLAGFAQFFPLLGVTRIGLGMRPDLCGQGLGYSFFQAIVQEARRRAPLDELDLEVHVWNVRAIRTYEKVGFVIDDTYERPEPRGSELVHCMVYT